MLGGIAGDMVGSVYEHAGLKSKLFPLFSPSSTFTDDTVLTVAVAESLLTSADLATTFKDWYRRYPWAGYGQSFQQWAREPNHTGPYNSWGNGSAMRVGPVGWACDDLEETLALAAATAEVTHNHPQGIAGAQATAGAIFLARTGSTKAQIKAFLETRFGYALDRSLDDIRRAIEFLSPTGASFLAGRLVDQALRHRLRLDGKSKRKIRKAGMADVIQAFVDAGHGTDDLHEALRVLQGFRNFAAHPPQPEDALAFDITQEEAAFLLSACWEILDFVYGRPARIAAMKERLSEKKLAEAATLKPTPTEPAQPVDASERKELQVSDDDVPF